MISDHTTPPTAAFGLARRAGWLAICTLALASCRSLSDGNAPPALAKSAPTSVKAPQPTNETILVSRASKGAIKRAIQKTEAPPIEYLPDTGLPIPMTNVTPWAPPGIEGPWPHDEYLFDGGDRDVQVNVGPDKELRGLELDDTVAVYDTIDGRTCVEPSNRVCLYAPRFAAVRKVTSVVQNEQRDQPIGIERPVRAHLHQDGQLATTAVQPIQPEGEIATKQPSIEQTNEGAIPAASRQPIAAMASGFSPHENFKAIRRGIFEESEKARLVESVDAAIAWTHDLGVQVVLDGRAAVAVTSEQSAQVTYRVDVPNHPCLRLIKVASTKVAKPGDVVDFTIRFDNMGDQRIAKMVLVDNLTTRLEYVPDTAQSSRDATFTTETNEGESLVLRWEFSEPLLPGQGGLVRFHCRVR